MVLMGSNKTNLVSILVVSNYEEQISQLPLVVIKLIQSLIDNFSQSS